MRSAPRICLVLALLLLATGPVLATPKRLAVVDVGPNGPVPAALADLLFASLAEQDNLVLLERDQIVRLLREQALSLQLGNDAAPDARVQAGKIWNVDAFLMLERVAAKTPVSEQNASDAEAYPIRVRLVDTRYGIKVFDKVVIVRTDGSDVANQAEYLAETSSRFLSKIKDNPEAMTTVALGALRNEEISRNGDWVAAALAESLERNLALHPDIVLLERSRTRRLMQERELAAGLPLALRASAVTIQGSYRIGHKDGTNVLGLSLRGLRNGDVVFAMEVSGKLDDLPALYRQIRQAVLTHLAENVAVPSMDVDKEAKLFADQALFYKRAGEPAKAFGPMDAALALRPDNRDYGTMMIWICVNDLFQTYFMDKAAKPDFARDLNRVDQTLAIADRLIRGHGRDETTTLAVSELLVRIGDVYNNQLGKFYPNLSAEQEQRLQEMTDAFWRLYQLSVDACKDGPYLNRFLYVAGRSYGLCRNFAEAMRVCTQGIDAYAKANRSPMEYSEMGGMLDSLERTVMGDWSVRWSIDQRTRQQLADYLESLCRHTNLAIRVCADTVMVRFYGRSGPHKDMAAVRRHVDALVQTFIRERVPTMWRRSYAAELGFQLDDIIAESGLPQNIVDQYKRDIAALLIQIGKPRALEAVASYADAFLRDADNARTLLDLIAPYRNAYGRVLSEDHGKQLLALLDRQPEIVDDPETLRATLYRAFPNLKPPDAYIDSEAVTLLAVDDKALLDSISRALVAKQAEGDAQHIDPSRLHLWRLIRETNLCAVVFSVRTEGLKERFGLLRLDPRTFGVRSVDVCMQDVERQDYRLNNFDRYSSIGPDVSVEDADVYVALPKSGVVHFSTGGKSVVYDEQKGMLSNHVRSLAVLDGIVYAKIGERFGDSGLMRYDSQTGDSAVLFSSRTMDPVSPLDGTLISGVIADHRRNCLWVLAGKTNPEVYARMKDDPNWSPSYDEALYRYDPATGVATPVDNPGTRAAWRHMYDESANRIRRVGHTAFVENDTVSVGIDMASETATILLTDGGNAGNATWHYPAYPLTHVTPLGENMVCTKRCELLYFTKGSNKPESLLEHYFTAQQIKRMQIRTLSSTEKGLLVLTNKTLYRLPDIGT